MADALGSDVSAWSTPDVLDWLTVAGLQAYTALVAAAEVTGADLLHLDEHKAERLGINVPEHRTLLADNLAALQGHGVRAQLTDAVARAKKAEHLMLSKSPTPTSHRLARSSSFVEYASLSYDMTSIATPSSRRRSFELKLTPDGKPALSLPAAPASAPPDGGRDKMVQPAAVPSGVDVVREEMERSAPSTRAEPRGRDALVQALGGTPEPVVAALLMMYDEQRAEIRRLTGLVTQLSRQWDGRHTTPHATPEETSTRQDDGQHASEEPHEHTTPILKEGTLTKVQHGLKRSHPRWFRLQAGVLQCFARAPTLDEDLPSKCMHLQDVEVTTTGFRSFRVKSVSAKRCDWVLKASSEEERNDWVHATRTAMTPIAK